MILQEFKYEDKPSKKQLLFEYGVFLTSRSIPDFQILLFQINDFYAEVYFDVEEEEIGYIRAFKGVRELDPYLSSIDISELVRLC